MEDVSLLRLYVLRATYLLIALGLGFTIWPGVLDAPLDLEHMRGVVRALLGAVGLLAVVGIRYPLRMLPLLLFELTWKAIWLLAIGLPLWLADAFTPGTRATWTDCLLSVVLLVVVLPWRHVWRHYVREPGGGWRRGVQHPASAQAPALRADAGRLIEASPLRSPLVRVTGHDPNDFRPGAARRGADRHRLQQRGPHQPALAGAGADAQ